MLTSAEWKRYFESNLRALLKVPWDLGAELTPEERQAIASSVQDFQAGESSEGRHLLRYAQKHAEQISDPVYVDAIRLFIAEEQRHGRDLGRFLQLNGIPLVKTTFTDRVFRWLRQLFGGLEISVSVLVTAEMIAKVYYSALKEATQSAILRTLCEQILRDEVRHVEFHTERLSILRADRNYVLLKCTMAIQRFLFFGTCLVVWPFHAQTFTRGGYDFARYWRHNWAEFGQAFRQRSFRRRSEDLKTSQV